MDRKIALQNNITKKNLVVLVSSILLIATLVTAVSVGANPLRDVSTDATTEETSSEELTLTPHETAGTLHDRLAAVGAQVAVQTLRGLENRVPTPQPQEGITWAPKITKEDGEIRFAEAAVALDRRVRAMTPWPGGWIPWGEKVLKLKKVRLAEGVGEPRTLLSLAPLVVACGEGALELVEVQAPGKKPVSGADFANGAHLALGGIL